MPKPARQWLRSELVFLIAIAAGVALRLFQISDQIIGDDEWHALQTAIFTSYGWIVSHFGANDFSIPLTLFYKLLMDTVGLSELGMRAPVLLFGLASLVAFPLLLRDALGRPAADLFAWLLAVAPLHVYYSRYARPYSITLFLSFVGVVAFFRWWTGGRRRWAVAYALCAIGGSYLHLTAMPGLLAPFVFALVDRAVRRGPRPGAPSLAELATCMASVAAGLALVLAPPLLSDWHAIGSKLAKQGPTLATATGALPLILGTAAWWLAGLGLAGVLVGVAALIRTRPTAAGYLLFVSTLALVSCLLASPALISVPVVLVRYNLLLLPVALLFLALGLTRLDTSLAAAIRPWPPGLAGALFCGLLLYFGPLRHTYYRPNAWTNHALFQYAYDADGGNAYAQFLAPRHIPWFYDDLRRLAPASVLLVEVPWYYEWHRNSYPFYQRRHRQRMAIGFVDDAFPPRRDGELPLTHPGLSFRNYLRVVDHEALRRRGVTFVVFHKNLHLENASPAGSPPVEVGPWVERYRAALGSPAYEDALLVVFDLTRYAGAPDVTAVTGGEPLRGGAVAERLSSGE
jgi:hypothetical protein